MNLNTILATAEQRVILNHEGEAFISACPGAGKTRVIVERARIISERKTDGRGVAFLSFTNAAVSELENRLRCMGASECTRFPNFVGTFDRFIWQFLIVPFGIPGCAQAPRLVPDKTKFEVQPFPTAQPLPLSFFDRATGRLDADAAKQKKFDISIRSSEPYEKCALKLFQTFMASAKLDFVDVRELVRGYLGNFDLASKLGNVLAARFREVIIDEAQDCNPDDLQVVDWFRSSGIATKVICDPHQSVYQFRGGVTHELLEYKNTFPESSRLSLSGNFRSTPAICRATSLFQLRQHRAQEKPLGPLKADTTPVYILAYKDKAPHFGIGQAFRMLMSSLNLEPKDAVVLASTRMSASKAVGAPVIDSRHSTLQLASAAGFLESAPTLGDCVKSLERLHEIVLRLQGLLKATTYREFILENGLEDGVWRPQIIEYARILQYRPSDSADEWLLRARQLITPMLPFGGKSAAQVLSRHSDLGTVLATSPAVHLAARTIHSVKGQEFLAVCVVLTNPTAKQLLDFIQSEVSGDMEEECRKIYVASSRARRLLAYAVPSSQAARLAKMLAGNGCTLRTIDLSRESGATHSSERTDLFNLSD